MDAEQPQKPSITSTVLGALRKEICSNVYSDGQFITEVEVSQKYGVSKTPAREALTILCQENLMHKIPRKGYMVKKLTLEELRKLYQFRDILERASVEFAVRHADDEEIWKLEELANVSIDTEGPEWIREYHRANTAFHIGMAALTQNDYLVDALRKVLNILQRDLIEDMKYIGVEKTLGAHKLIVEAIKARDLETALRISTEQINIIDRKTQIFLTAYASELTYHGQQDARYCINNE
ncbi:GntR family transcriptional regulator [Selenomonas sp. TAMA-11512]|nr:GntR family transcriptional regulator [Selenomonas sp. TAMA-11512]